MISEFAPGGPALPRARAPLWGDAVRSTASGESVSAAVCGSMDVAVADALADRELTLGCAEFGTYDPIRVFWALRADNWLHAHGDPESARGRRDPRRAARGVPAGGPGLDAERPRGRRGPGRARARRPRRPPDPSFRSLTRRHARTILGPMAEQPRRVLSVDAEKLPKHFDAAAAERKWDAVWQESGIYHCDPARPRAETFVVDTPPPTVSGSLHVGPRVQLHAHRRHRALPAHARAERLLPDGLGRQRPAHRAPRAELLPRALRCPARPTSPGLALEPATRSARKEPPRSVSRPNFIELCLERDARGREVVQGALAAARPLGRLAPGVLDDRRPLPAHRAALVPRPVREGPRLQRSRRPTMWDVDFQTAVAQAEVEDRARPGAFHDIEFARRGRRARS